YGPLLPIEDDPSAAPTPLSAAVGRLPPGTRYVLCVLRPSREFALDADDLRSAVEALTGARALLPDGDYVTIAGRVGDAPAMAIGSARPFREAARVGDVPVEIRMESWLTFDTIRRMGFGQVIAGRHHTLIVERGVSFASFDDRGVATTTAYQANVFAPQPRYRIRRLNLP